MGKHEWGRNREEKGKDGGGKVGRWEGGRGGRGHLGRLAVINWFIRRDGSLGLLDSKEGSL